MGYLTDSGLWLCVGLGFVVGATISIFALLFDSFAKNPNIQAPRILRLLGTLAVCVYTFAAVLLSIKYMQARFGVNADLQVTAYTVGFSMGVPTALWLVLKRRRQWQASRSSSQ